MTLEEAKKKIEERGDDAWKKWKKEGNLISQGYALGMDDALGIVDKLDTGSSGNPEQLTLRELAQALRKIFPFRFITSDCEENRVRTIKLWLGEPEFNEKHNAWWSGVCVNCFHVRNLAINLDLSEYKDADGDIDYSKCIVEVE